MKVPLFQLLLLGEKLQNDLLCDTVFTSSYACDFESGNIQRDFVSTFAWLRVA